MEQETLRERLKSKPDLQRLVTEAGEDPALLAALLAIAKTERSSLRYSATKAVRILSEQKPEQVYSHHTAVVSWMRTSNSFVKWDGILTLGNLAAVDRENRFAPLYGEYFGLLRDPQMVTAANVVRSAWKFVLSRPEWEPDITRRLLEVPEITYLHHGTPSPECNRVLCGHLLDCFDRYFDSAQNPALLLSFAQNQLHSPRQAVAKAAARFLRCHGGKTLRRPPKQKGTPMLETMSSFFNSRLDGYEEHQLHAIAQAEEFYPFTAQHLPALAGARVLDLGCGTGLELGYYFAANPTAEVTGIDLAGDMLQALAAKFPDKRLTLIHDSYFDVPLGEGCYDAAISVESLHHFTHAEKIPLYARVRRALAPGGYFLLTDYFAESDGQEAFFREELRRLKAEQGIREEELCHYDTPLTVEHETEALQKGGFSRVEVLGQWGPTCLLRAAP